MNTMKAWIRELNERLSLIHIYKGKQYRLKRTKDWDAAIKARKEAEEAVKNGDFEKWRIKENQRREDL